MATHWAHADTEVLQSCEAHMKQHDNKWKQWLNIKQLNKAIFLTFKHHALDNGLIQISFLCSFFIGSSPLICLNENWSVHFYLLISYDSYFCIVRLCKKYLLCFLTLHSRWEFSTQKGFPKTLEHGLNPWISLEIVQSRVFRN